MKKQGSQPLGQAIASEYMFTSTQDWFRGNMPTWRKLFALLSAPAPRVLEIGCWEGRSSVFLLNELCATRNEGSVLVTIDHFDLLRTEAGRARHARVLKNLARTGQPHRVITEFSVPGLMQLLKDAARSADGDANGFDWVYIDGSHEADDTLLDGELAWRLARKDAIVIFDDYHWPTEPESSLHHPRRGIDAFLALHDGEYTRLSSAEDYQVVLRKTTPMRIGFLVDGDALGECIGNTIYSSFETPVNVAITVDSAYALPAAVVILSAVRHTPGRISIFVVDCGLSAQDRSWLEETTLKERNADVTLSFLPLPSESLTSGSGRDPRWAKVDMIPILPVERVLYLDADSLVRSDLRELWRTDLNGKPIGAVVDIGFPMGHNQSMAPYFNAGILLIDLTLVRAAFPELRAAAVAGDEAKYQDQDVLNSHFHGRWASLGLRWNAQGLGTYANDQSAHRAALPLEDMRDPAIVHFTGPLSPPMAAVLNPYVQPFTAKPWGYAGAPGHPFAEEWWGVARATSWADWLRMGGLSKVNEKEKSIAIRKGLEQFESLLPSGPLTRHLKPVRWTSRTVYYIF